MSGSISRSSRQFVKRLLNGSENCIFPRKLRETTLYHCFTPGFVLKPYLPEFGTLMPVQNSVSRRIESLAKVNSSILLPHPVVVEQLSSRRLMKVRGPDSAEFLQMIVTADVAQLAGTEASKSCSYTMLLSMDGRVLFDVLLYKISEDEYWMEYDAIARIPFRKHLETFSQKKRVNIEYVDDMSVWVAYQSSSASVKTLLDVHRFASHFRAKLLGNIVVEDPRVSELGCRIILLRSVDLHAVLCEFPLKSPSSEDCYSIQRYKLGVGEGMKDHPPHECLPLECNLDYLGGIRFDKDYYIGKELCTHIHKTNFVWRRLMPVMLSNSSPSFAVQEHCIPANCPLINQNGLMMGRLRNNFGIYGLAALNAEAALEADTVMTLKGFNIRAKVTRPIWWPDEPTQDGRRSSVF